MENRIYGAEEEYGMQPALCGPAAPCRELVLAMDVSRQTAGCGPVLEQTAAAILAALQQAGRPIRFTYIKYRSGEIISRKWLRAVAVGQVSPRQLKESGRAGLADPAGAVRYCLEYQRTGPQAARRVVCLLSGDNAALYRNAAAKSGLLAAARETCALERASGGRFLFTAAVAEPEQNNGQGARRLQPFAADERNVWSLPETPAGPRIRGYADWVAGLLCGESVTPVELEMSRYFHTEG